MTTGASTKPSSTLSNVNPSVGVIVASSTALLTSIANLIGMNILLK